MWTLHGFTLSFTVRREIGIYLANSVDQQHVPYFDASPRRRTSNGASYADILQVDLGYASAGWTSSGQPFCRTLSCPCCVDFKQPRKLQIDPVCVPQCTQHRLWDLVKPESYLWLGWIFELDTSSYQTPGFKR